MQLEDWALLSFSSPGFGHASDLDDFIDNNCQDSDVFVLIVSYEKEIAMDVSVHSSKQLTIVVHYRYSLIKLAVNYIYIIDFLNTIYKQFLYNMQIEDEMVQRSKNACHILLFQWLHLATSNFLLQKLKMNDSKSIYFDLIQNKCALLFKFLES